MYRPEGWINPFKRADRPLLLDDRDERIYEAGADAMLKALKAQPDSVKIGKQGIDGTLVFIPDGKE